MRLVAPDPVTLRLEGATPEQLAKLRSELTYVDKRADFGLTKARRSLKKFRSPRVAGALQDKWGQAKYEAVIQGLERQVAELTAKRKQCLLREDAAGAWVPSGIGVDHVVFSLGEALALEMWGKRPAVEIRYQLPEPEPIRWAEVPKHKNRPYQDEAVDALLVASCSGPAAVEMATGAGKSAVIRSLLKAHGLGAVVMAPSASIAGQLHADLVRHFGPREVGMFGGGKKQPQKRFVVGIDDSLTRVEPGTEAWAQLSAKPVFVADESHLCPAESLRKVCYGLVRNAPYRYFLSATQLRTDGLDLELEGITGPVVYRKAARELVDAGWLAKPHFRMVRVRTRAAVRSDDANRMTRAHLYYNPEVSRVAGELAQNFVRLLKRPTLILVEELEQFGGLLPHLGGLPVAFAHGPLSKEKAALVPEAYRDADNADLVERFNAGQFPVLVGTSAVATGTDLQANEATLYLMGQKSEIKVRQAVGRGTRGGRLGNVYNPWTGKQKVDVVHVDFDPVPEREEDWASFAPHRHAEVRAEVYADLYAPPQLVDRT